MPGLDADHRDSGFGQTAEQPLRQRSSLKSDPAALDAGRGQHRGDYGRVSRHLGLADDATFGIDDADAGLVQGDIQSGLMFHVCPTARCP